MANFQTLTPINPIGRCFETTYHVYVNPNTDINAIVCHGIGIATFTTMAKQKIAHSWIEFNENGKIMAIDTTFCIIVDAAIYRDRFQPSYIIEYSRCNYLKNCRETKTFGPWDEKIAALASEWYEKLALSSN